MNELTQHFLTWKSFNTKVYIKTLTSEDIVGNGAEKYIDVVQEVTKHDTTYIINENKIVNMKCIFIEKNGVKYILPTQYQQNLPINVKDYFECYLKNSDKTIYKFITNITTAKITGDKTLSFKNLIESFNPLDHTSPRTWQFLKIQAIASKYKGGKYRICSKPSTGKSCNDVILHMITNDNVRVSTPTLAKLESLFYFNQKVLPDEMTSLTPTQVCEVEPFFLTLADESPTFTKHSMARRKDMNEVNISMSSCVFTYNDPASLQTDSKFFDDIWQNKAAFSSRYPAFFVDGEITTTLSKLNMYQAEQILDKNYEELRILAKNIMYYIQNMSQELHGYDRRLLNLKGRHKVNTECIIDALDVYCDTQLEFNEWLMWINDSIDKYQELVWNKDGYKYETKEESINQ